MILIATFIYFLIGVLLVYFGSSFAFLSWQNLNIIEWQPETRMICFIWFIVCFIIALGVKEEKS